MLLDEFRVLTFPPVVCHMLLDEFRVLTFPPVVCLHTTGIVMDFCHGLSRPFAAASFLFLIFYFFILPSEVCTASSGIGYSFHLWYGGAYLWYGCASFLNSEGDAR